MADRKLGRHTSPGFGDPHENARGQATVSQRPARPPGPSIPAAALPAPPSAPQPAVARQPAASVRPRAPRIVEVEIVHERGRTPRPDPAKRSFEIWTQNTVYVLDSRMRCLEVVAPGSQAPKPNHPFLGARLVGGQLQNEGSIEMSYPFPRPGSFAVFELRKGNRSQFSRTSSVERVVIRERIVTLIGPNEPTWPDLVAGMDELDDSAL